MAFAHEITKEAPMFDNPLFWAGLAAVAVAIVYGIDRLFRTVVNRSNADAGRYPHRVAKQLPRTLHTPDHDEVLDLKDETELATK
jgi:hypothetical protein